MIYCVIFLCSFIMIVTTYCLVKQDNKIKKINEDYLELFDKYYKMANTLEIFENNVNIGYDTIAQIINKHSAYDEYLHMKVEDLEQCIKDDANYLAFESDLSLPDPNKKGNGGLN